MDYYSRTVSVSRTSSLTSGLGPPQVPLLHSSTDTSNFSAVDRPDDEWSAWDEFNDRSADALDGFDPMRDK